MDQESCNHPSICNESGPTATFRGRRCVALAAVAVVLASASSTVAFSPSSTSAQQSPQSSSNGSFQSAKKKRKAPQRRSSTMIDVSILEAPTTTAPIPATTKRTTLGMFQTSRVRRGPADDIELQPNYDFLGMEDFVVATSPSRKSGSDLTSSESSGVAAINGRAPEIDSEILYEGITRAPPQPLYIDVDSTNSLQKEVAPASVEFEIELSEVVTVNEEKLTEKKKRKSSTMPGYLKDKDLDLHIANLGLRRLPTKELKLTRMVRSKSAKMKRRQTNSEAMYKKASSVPDSLLDYTQEIHAVSRVTPKEEKDLGTKTQEAIRLQRLHDDLKSKYGREPSDDEWCAAAGKLNILALEEAIHDGMQAKNQLVASNLRMVQRVVNLYIRNGLGSEYNAGDLMQDGTMALIRAAEKYEPDRGFRFSTYAMYWIRSAVKRSQTSQSRIVTIPQRLHETHKRIVTNEVQLRKELGREATKGELAKACNISVVQLDRCRRAMSQVTFSLDAELENSLKPNNGSSRKDTMYDIVEEKADKTEYERTQRLFMKEHLIGTLRRYLSPQEVDLLLLRYGLMDDRALPKGMSGPLTIAEVSTLVGLKPDKVRRIIINSQKQLRHLMKEWEDFEFA